MSIFYFVHVRSAEDRPFEVHRGAVSMEVSDTVAKICKAADYQQDSKITATAKHVSYNAVMKDKNLSVAVCDDMFPRRLVFAFLERVSAGNPTKNFILSEMEFFSTNPDADKIRRIQTDVNEVKDLMMENISKVLYRGERLEDIDRKTDDLRLTSGQFQHRSSALRCALIRQNAKLTVIIVMIVLFIVCIIGSILIWQASKSRH